MFYFLKKIKPLWVVFRWFWYRVATQFLFIPLLVQFAKSKIRPFPDAPVKNNAKITLLVLNHSRFIHDLNELAHHPNVQVNILPHEIQALINSIFWNDYKEDLKGMSEYESSKFFREPHTQSVIDEQKCLHDYLCRFLPLF